jgi:hypothetical protein
MRIMGLSLVAVFAVAAVFAGSASAKAGLVLKTAAGPLAPGAEVKAFSSDLTFTTEAGALECTKNTLTGTLANNNASKDKGSITTESSTGEGTGFGSACKTSTPFGPAGIESVHLAWPIEFSTKGVATVKKGAGGKIAFISTFVAAPGEPKCQYETAKVLSSFNATLGSGPITLTTTEQLFKKNKKASNEACPATGKLNGTFTMTSGGEPVED